MGEVRLSTKKQSQQKKKKIQIICWNIPSMEEGGLCA